MRHDAILDKLPHLTLRKSSLAGYRIATLESTSKVSFFLSGVSDNKAHGS